MKFKVGDRVIGVGESDGLDLTGHKGTIISNENGDYVVKFDIKFTDELHAEDGRCWCIYDDDTCIEHYTEDPKVLKKIKDLNMKNLHIDPYSEENWLEYENENLILRFDDFVNENFIDDMKDKLMKWWGDFQNKEMVVRQVVRCANYGEWGLLFIFIATLLTIYFPHMFGSTIGQFVNGNRTNIAIGWFIISIIPSIKKKLKKIRPEYLKAKMKELVELFKDEKYLDDFYAVFGSKKGVTKALDKLKEDGVITDRHIIQLPDITIVDFTGTHDTDTDLKRVEDPYGEEDWHDDVDRIEAMIAHRVAGDLEDKYGVIFRRINAKPNMFNNDEKIPGEDKIINKITGETEREERNYNRGLKDIAKHRKERQEIPEPVDHRQNDLNAWAAAMMNDLEHNKVVIPIGPDDEKINIGDIIFIHDENYGVRDIDEVDKEAYAYPTRLLPVHWIEQALREVERKRDEEAEKKPRRNFMANFGDFVVPGFDIKRPEVKER